MTPSNANDHLPDLLPEDDRWIPLCQADEVWEEAGKRVDLEGEEPLAVFCIEGDYYVTADTCSHGEASLCEGYVVGSEVECPWHNGRFDIKSGAATCYPAVAPIRVYRTKVVGGEVFFSKF